jgi:hypothetical protein
MRRRIVISAAIFLVLAIGIVAGYWFLRPQPRIDEEAFGKIKVGMTESEVVAIIGASAGNHGVGDAELVWPHAPFLLANAKSEAKVWFGQTHAIAVSFGPDNTVAEKLFFGVWREHDSQFERICQALHLKEPAVKPRPMHW